MAWAALLESSAPGLLAALFYAFVSGSMSFMNKAVMTTFHFDFPDVIMLAQVAMTSLLVELSRVMKLIDIPPWSLQRCREFLFPSFCFALHTTLALAALSSLSIPMYNVLRRMLPLVNLLTARFVLKKTPSRWIITSVVIIVSGTLFASLGDLQFNLTSYANALCSVIAQATYLSYVEKTGVENHASALSVLHLNSINCIPMLLLLTVANGNLVESTRHINLDDSHFTVTFICNVCMGCLLNYSLFLCATMNSALTTSLVGVLKGVVTTVIGFFTFGGVPLTLLTLGGVTINAVGGILYTTAKYSQKMGKIKSSLNNV